jgi:WXG100 family type VII secretion target
MRTGPGNGGFGAGGGYATDLDVMLQAKTHIQNKHDDIVAEVNKLMSALEGVAWNGPARLQFDQAKLDWHTVQGKLQGKLISIMDGIGTSQQQYLQTDTDNQAAIGHVTSL